MQTHCEKCGTENAFISNIKSLRCKTCRHPLDWRLKVKCPNCGVTNHLNRGETAKANCSRCYNTIRADKMGYIPNQVPVQERVLSILLACTFIAASLYALIYQHLVLPYGGKYRGHFWRFDGYEMTLPVAALILAVIGLLSIVVDHYDKRENEHVYKVVRRCSLGMALLIYFVSIFFGHPL